MSDSIKQSYAEYPLSTLSAPIELVDLAAEIDKAHANVHMVANAKLTQIAEQMRFLHKQAQEVLERAKLDSELHAIPCRFYKKPGQIYNVYEKKDGTRYFSLLNPSDWDGNPPHHYIGTYRLGADSSWTPVAE